jgi:YHS domain-containing protein
MPAIAIIDPVCGMELDDSPHFRTEYAGRTYSFCSTKCREKFVANTGLFLREQSEDETSGRQPSAIHRRQKGRGQSWRDYIPLIVIVALTLLAATAKQAAYSGAREWQP